MGHKEQLLAIHGLDLLKLQFNYARKVLTPFSWSKLPTSSFQRSCWMKNILKEVNGKLMLAKLMELICRLVFTTSKTTIEIYLSFFFSFDSLIWYSIIIWMYNDIDDYRLLHSLTFRRSSLWAPAPQQFLENPERPNIMVISNDLKLLKNIWSMPLQ